MSYFDEKWNIVPSVEMPTKEEVEAMIKQAHFDKRLAKSLPKIIKRYNISNDEKIAFKGDLTNR